MHALRSDKWTGRAAERAALAGVLVQLPEWLARAPLVLLDTSQKDDALLFATPAGAGAFDVVIVRLDQRDKRADQPVVAGWVRTVETKTAAALRSMRVLRGQLP